MSKKPLPLEGNWQISNSHNVASFVLPKKRKLQIRSSGGKYVIRGPQANLTWGIHFVSSDFNAIWGKLGTSAGDQFGFLIGIGGRDTGTRHFKPGVHGLLYPSVGGSSGKPGEGQDPGTWEADEDDGDPDSVCQG